MDKFIVSARKYRPATFESVVGQSHITSTLKNAISRNQLAHAYLFCGPRGVGKTTCARILAKAINCQNPTSEMEACNNCVSCKSFDEGGSFNIHELDAASNTSVDNIRSLTDQVRTPPQIGKYSVYIIDEVHMLSTSAFNAFLKTLEEPPSHVVFILATTEKHKILPTILSRCQIYDFKRIKIEDVVYYLKFISSEEGIKYDDESLHMIAQKADGCMRDALSMFDKVVSFCNSDLQYKEVSAALNILDYDTYFNFCDMIYAGDYQNALITFDDILQKGFEPQTFISGLASHLRDLLIARTPKTSSLLEVTGSVADRYKKQSQSININFIFSALNIITQAESSIKVAINQRLHCELAIIKLSNINSVDNNTSQEKKTPLIEPNKSSEHIIQPNKKEEPVTQTISKNTEQKKSETEKTSIITENTAIKTTSTQAIQNNETPVRERADFGITSIKNLRKGEFNLQSSQNNEEKSIEIEQSKYLSSIEDIEDVLSAIQSYADGIEDVKPRIAIALKDSKIEDGKIRLSVASSILEEELIKQKHEILSEIKNLCGIGGLDFTVSIDTTIPESKKIFVKSEDKLELFKSKNPVLEQFIKELDLHLAQ